MDSQEKPAATEPTISPKTIWISLIIAGAVPVIAIMGLVILMVLTNYNVMEWLE